MLETLKKYDEKVFDSLLKYFQLQIKKRDWQSWMVDGKQKNLL